MLLLPTPKVHVGPHAGPRSLPRSRLNLDLYSPRMRFWALRCTAWSKNAHRRNGQVLASMGLFCLLCVSAASPIDSLAMICSCASSPVQWKRMLLQPSTNSALHSHRVFILHVYDMIIPGDHSINAWFS